MQPTPGRFSNMVASPTLCLSRFFSPSPSGAADKTSFFTLIFLLCIWTFIHVLADKYFPRRGYENGVISVFIVNACDMLKLTVRPWLFCRCKDVNAGFLSPGSLRLPLRLCVKSKDCRFSIKKKKKKYFESSLCNDAFTSKVIAEWSIDWEVISMSGMVRWRIFVTILNISPNLAVVCIYHCLKQCLCNQAIQNGRKRLEREGVNTWCALMSSLWYARSKEMLSELIDICCVEAWIRLSVYKSLSFK